jgi:NAD(P)-dependent dehydrogenase (short-subunit alcohol dehydrogenase family)
MRLQDKVAIVTGSGRGIGRAIALGFAAEGARLVVADVRQDLAESTAAEIQSGGAQALALVVEAAVERFGRLDILHNNAGILGQGDLFACTPDEWDAVLAVNLKAAFFATQKAARVMIDQGSGGRILNTASTSAFIASSHPTIPYDVSKAGMRQLTVSFAAHLVQYGITVNAIAPGTIETELTLGAGDRTWLERRVKDRIPMGRLGQPRDLVGAAVYLCSDEAAYVTGHTLVVDGGILLL